MAIPREGKIMTSKILKEEKAYIAGFIDGDGCILSQIVKRKDYKYRFQIRVSVTFYQKTTRHWFMLWLKKKLKHGSIRIRGDNISEYTIVGYAPVQALLKELYPYLRIKRPTAKLILEIIDKVKTVNTKEDFLEVCQLVDKVAQFTDSKKRRNTSQLVKDVLFPPVETESEMLEIPDKSSRV